MSNNSPACPICGEPVVKEYKPFCSRRCADVDLNRWLSSNYTIPGEEAAIVTREDEDEHG